MVMVNIPVVLLKFPPSMVKFPLTVMAASAPLNVAALKVAFPAPIFMVTPGCMSTLPLYPVLKCMPKTFALISMRQALEPFTSKMAKSLDPGTEAPPIPPEVADQLAVLLQLLKPATVATQ